MEPTAQERTSHTAPGRDELEQDVAVKLNALFLGLQWEHPASDPAELFARVLGGVERFRALVLSYL